MTAPRSPCEDAGLARAGMEGGPDDGLRPGADHRADRDRADEELHLPGGLVEHPRGGAGGPRVGSGRPARPRGRTRAEAGGGARDPLPSRPRGRRDDGPRHRGRGPTPRARRRSRSTRTGSRPPVSGRSPGYRSGDMVEVDSGDRLRIGDIENRVSPHPRTHPRLAVLSREEHPGLGRHPLHSGLRPGRPSRRESRTTCSAACSRLAELPDETVLLPGHNYDHVPSATVGETKASNPYLMVRDIETWRRMMG